MLKLRDVARSDPVTMQLEEVVRVGPGEAQFVELIEKLTGRDLTIRKSGRPLKHGS
jgi:hypothetical protein